MTANLFRSLFRRAYRLRPLEPRAQDHIAQVRVGGPNAGANLLLPYSAGLGYLLIPADASKLAIAAQDFRVERLDAATSLWARLRLGLLFKKKKYLTFEDFSIFSYGPKAERKRFSTFNQHMFNIGVSLDGDLVAAHPELIEGWGEVEAPARTSRLRDIAIVAHVYYEDSWPDIAGALSHVEEPFDLIVTTAPGREGLIDRVRRDYPDAEIAVFENRGRDVRPFLALLEAGRLDPYRYVCKVHGKKSSDGGRMAYMGSVWRRRLLFDLLGAPNAASRIIDDFERNPSIGMIGSSVFRMPGKAFDEQVSWGENWSTVLALAADMGVAPEAFRLDFFAGTMFWVRPRALAPLRRLLLTSKFPVEQGRSDGALEHAVERLFATSVVAAGLRLEACGAEAQDEG